MISDPENIFELISILPPFFMMATKRTQLFCRVTNALGVRYAASFLTATYPKVRLVRHVSQCLIPELFSKPSNVFEKQHKSNQYKKPTNIVCIFQARCINSPLDGFEICSNTRRHKARGMRCRFPTPQ